MDKFVQKAPAPKSLPHASPRKGKELDLREQPAKRVKREIADSDAEPDGSSSDGETLKAKPKPAALRRCDTADTSVSINDESPNQSEPENTPGRPTAIESALPEVKTDKEAIEEYESFRASQGDKAEGLASRFVNREWVKGKSSLYVDAFNLALSTVLEDEFHLFDDNERALFDYWENLSYEAQYL